MPAKKNKGIEFLRYIFVPWNIEMNGGILIDTVGPAAYANESKFPAKY